VGNATKNVVCKNFEKRKSEENDGESVEKD
jgi:hypothetical protein